MNSNDTAIRDLEFVSREALHNKVKQAGSVMALLDAARVPGLPARIENDQIEAYCLLDDEATGKLRDVAPYLLRLSADCSMFRDLTDDGDAPSAMWPKQPGILLQADLDLAAVRQHLRQFMRIQTEGRVLFFRFWEPPNAALYFTSIAQSDARYNWFFPRDAGFIDEIMIPDLNADGLHIYRAGNSPHVRHWENDTFNMCQRNMNSLQTISTQDNVSHLVMLMVETFPALSDTPDKVFLLEHSIRRSVARSIQFGIRMRNNVFRIAAWDLHADGNFEEVDPGGELHRISIADLPEAEKMRKLIARLAELRPANN